MSQGRPRTAIGTFGQVHVTDLGGRYRALTWFRDLDGRLRRVTATAGSARRAQALLKERLLHRAGYGTAGLLSLASPFGELAELWLADLELRDIAENTKENYRNDLPTAPAVGSASTTSGGPSASSSSSPASRTLNRPGESGESFRWKDLSHVTSLEVHDRAA